MTPTLDGFCKSIAAKRRLTPTGLAQPFVKFFGLSSPPTMSELRGMLRRTGIQWISVATLPESLHGTHGSLDGASHIIKYLSNDRKDEQKHTLLHETYEIIREMLGYPQVDPARDSRPCREADRFAIVVLSSMDIFADWPRASRIDGPVSQTRTSSPTLRRRQRVAIQRGQDASRKPTSASLLRPAHRGRRISDFLIMPKGRTGKPLRGELHPLRKLGRTPPRESSNSGRPLIFGQPVRPLYFNVETAPSNSLCSPLLPKSQRAEKFNGYLAPCPLFIVPYTERPSTLTPVGADGDHGVIRVGASDVAAVRMPVSWYGRQAKGGHSRRAVCPT